MKSLLFCVFCGVFLGCVLSDRRIERKCTVIFYCLSGTLCSARNVDMSGFLIVFSCSFYVVFKLEVGVGSLIFFGLLRGSGRRKYGRKERRRIRFFFCFFLYFAFKRVAFALLRNSIRFCAKFAQDFIIFLILENEN